MTPEAARDALRRQLQKHGETVTVRLLAGTAMTPSDHSVGARIIGRGADALTGLVEQDTSRAIVSAEDYEALSPARDPKAGDHLIVRGKARSIETVDSDTRRINGVLVAYVLDLKG